MKQLFSFLQPFIQKYGKTILKVGWFFVAPVVERFLKKITSRKVSTSPYKEIRPICIKPTVQNPYVPETLAAVKGKISFPAKTENCQKSKHFRLDKRAKQLKRKHFLAKK
jgi:hypothetical protein